jgi:hypothetical protein
MKLRRIIFLAGLFLLSVSITGCMYLRLLELKGQLSDFTRYFRIEDKQKLELVFLEPVLLDDDILWIMKSDPMSRQETEQGEVWEYVFEKQYGGEKNEEGNFDIPVDMIFQNGKLEEVRFPERFLKYISKPLLAKMFQSMGNAEISKLRRSADSEFQGGSSLEIPRKEQIVEILGEPFSVEDSDSKSEFKYRYKLKRPESDLDGEEFDLKTEFTFTQGDDRLLRAEGDIDGLLKMSMDFSFEESNENKNSDK